MSLLQKRSAGHREGTLPVLGLTGAAVGRKRGGRVEDTGSHVVASPARATTSHPIPRTAPDFGS